MNTFQRVWAAAALLSLGASGCGDGRSSDVTRSTQALRASTGELPEFVRARTRQSEIVARGNSFEHAIAKLPNRATDRLRMKNGESSVDFELEALGARDVRGELEGGSVVYRGAFSDTDVVFTARGARVEELRVLRSPAAPNEARYRIHTSGAVRIDRGAVEVRGPDGRLAFRSLPAYAVDATGKKRALSVTLEGTPDAPVLFAKLDTKGLAYPISVDPTWVSGGAGVWPSEALVALNSLWHEGGGVTTGNAAVIDAAPGAVLADSAELVVGVDAVVHGTVSANRVRVRLAGTVDGDVRTNDLVNLGTVTGATLTPLALPLAIPTPTLPAITPGTTDVTLAARQDLTLPPGAYRSVTLGIGTSSDPTVLTLSGGVYHMSSLNFGAWSTVQCTAACELRVQGRITPGLASYLGPASGSNLSPADVQVFVTGINGTSGSLSALPKAASFGLSSTLAARLFVPNGTLWVRAGSAVTGTLIAKDLQLGLGVQVTKDTAGGCNPDDGNPCTADSCDPVTGQPHHDPVPAGTSCSNGNACDGAETCDGAGTCQAGSPVVCTASDQCHDPGTCNPANGTCSSPAKPNGSACNDANACTQSDTCQAGTCTGANPVVCTASDQCHDAGTCNPANGTCSDPAKPNGTSCNDANACTQTDTCEAGACTGANPIVCTASDQCHDAGACNPANGTCSNPAKADGSACNDANACTQTDTCQSGTCTGANPVVCTASDQCHIAGTCSPVTGACSNPSKPNGSACDDGSACTSGEVCTSGACGGGTGVPVDDGNPCTADACDANGGVTHTPVAAGTSCGDSNACNGSETCDAAGACQPGTPPSLDDGNPCTVDACDAIAGITHVPAPSGTSCADTNACNGAETCNGSGACVAGTPPALDDGNPCTADACDPVAGITHTPVAAGTSCADSNACNGSETCDAAGACQPGTPPTLDDGNPCTADACDPASGVSHTPVTAGTSCADSNLCNGDESCDGSGVCQPGTPPNIDDDNVCTADACDPATGISHTPVAAGTSCADATVCNGAETCDAGGTCQAGTPLPVDDGNVCTTDACDPTSGVSHVTIPGCDPAPTTPGQRFETRASLIGRLIREGGAAVTGYALTVHDAPATGAPRSDVQLTVAADGSFRARLSTFPDSAPPKTPAHKVVVGITGDDFAPITRVAYLYPGDAVNFGEITVLDLDPQVTMIGPGGGVATDSQGLVELTFPPGAVSTTIPVRITPIQARKKFPFPLPDSTATGYGIALLPHTQEFAVPVTMRLLNYRNIPTNLAIPVGTVDYVNGTWDHTGLATWDGQRFRTTIRHFSAVDANPGTPGDLAFRLRNGLDSQKSSSAACGASSISYGSGSVRQVVRLPGTTRRGDEYGFTFHYDSGLAGSRTVGTAPTTPFQATGGPGIAIPIVGPSIETICVPPGSSAPAGFCGGGGGGGSCTIGMAPAVDLGWTQYVAGQIAKKNSEANQTTVGIGAGMYINLPPNPDGTLPKPSHMVSDFVSLFAGTTGGGGTCTGNGGGFAAGASDGTPQVTDLEPGPQVRHRSYVLAYHRRTSAFGAGWGLEQVREAFLTPSEDQLDIVHGDGQRETFHSRTDAVLSSTTLAIGEKAMGRDRITGEVFYATGTNTIYRLNADGTSTTLLSGLALPGAPVSLAVAYVAGERRFALGCQNGLAMVRPSGAVTIVSPRTGPLQPSPGVAAVGSVVFYTDAIGNLIHKYDFADPTLTDDAIGDPSGELSIDPKQPAGGVAFDRPEGLAIGANNELYVACARRHTVYALAPDGSGLPSDASTVTRVVGRGSGSMIAPVGLDTPGPLFSVSEPFALDVAADGTLFILSYMGLAKYDPASKNARWFAQHGEFGVSFRLNRSFVATSPSEIVLTTRVGGQAYTLRDLGLTSEYDPTRRATVTPTGITVTDSSADTLETYTFDDSSRTTGHLTELRRRTGELVYRLAWLPSGQDLRLDFLEDPTGGKHQFAYDGQGKLLRITDPAGRQIQFSVNAQGDLSSITYPSGEVHHYDYEFHRMVVKRDPRGEQTAYVYRTDGTADHATRPNGGTLTMRSAMSAQDTWDADGRPVFEALYTDDRGVQHTVTINAAGHIERDVFTADGVAYDVKNVYQTTLGRVPATATDGTERPNDLFRVSHTTVNGLTVTPITSFDTHGRPIQRDLPLNSLTSGQTSGETAGNFWKWAWGSDGRLTQTRPTGTNIFWPVERDANNRVSRIHDERINGFGPTGRESLFTWRPDGQPATVTEHGVTSTLGYHPTSANLTSSADTLGRTLAMTYSPAGNVETLDDGTTTVTFGHDDDNRLTTITDALGHVTTMGYAHAGCSCAYGDRLTSLHTPDLLPNQKWSFTYDPDGQLSSVTDPLGKTEAYTYNPSRDLIGFTDRKNRSTTFTYDQLGRPSTTTDPLLRKGTFAYPVPASGNWTGAAVFAGSPDTQAAPTNLTASLRDGEYQIGLREHRAGGNPAQVEFYRDATFELSFGRSFDAYGRLLRREDRVGLPFASGNTFGTATFFDHDLAYENNTPLPFLASYSTSRPGGVEDSLLTNNFEFDMGASIGLGAFRPYTDEVYTRDAAGRVATITTNFRVSGSVYPFQTLGVTYHPANKRQVQQLTSGSGVQDFTYDARGLVATRAVTFERSAGPTTLGTFSYSQYDAVGRNTLLTYPDGHTRTQIWDELGRLRSRCYAAYPGGGPTRCYTADYDEVGNPTLLGDPERSCTVTYDDLDRLESVTCTDGTTETYAYNALGALSTHAGVAVDHQRPRISGGGSASAGLPATHGGQPVGLDAVGKVTSLAGMTLDWNRLGRLVSTTQAGVTTTYGHDSFFRRAVQQRAGSPLELYLYEGPNVAAVAHGAGVASVDRRFLYDDVDHPLWMWDRVADAGIYFELDCIGNVRRLRGGARYGAGSVLPSDLGGYKYSAFGRGLAADAGTPAPVVDGGGFSQPLRWQGRWLDSATGIYDVRNRQWSPELGAFLSADELERFGQHGTLWSWPRNNPLRFGDPSGRSTLGRAVAGGLGAFLGAEIGFSIGGGSGLLVGLAEGGVPAVATAPAGAVAGAAEGALLGGALGIAIYDLSETFLGGASATAAASASLAVPVPSLDVTGKVHGDLPDHVPDSWTAEQLREAADDLRASVRRRKQEQLDLGEDAAHRERIRQEERLLKQIEKVLGGKCE